MIIENLYQLYLNIVEETLASIYTSHEYFWNGNAFFFILYIASLTIVIANKEDKSKAKRLFAAFSVFVILICYCPITRMVFLRLPESDEAVFSRFWVILPVWMVIAFAVSEVKNRIKSVFIQNGLYLIIAAGIVLTGSSVDSMGYYFDANSLYKVKTEGINIANQVASISENEPVELLLFDNTQVDTSDNFVPGGTVSSAIGQYSAEIQTIPCYVDEVTWQDCYISSSLTDGDTASVLYVDDMLAQKRMKYDFSFVAMPKDYLLRIKMLYSGYKYVSSVNGYDLYQAKPRWTIQSFSGYFENYNKVYLCTDNMGHLVLIDGGSKTDRRQLQLILNMCCRHIDVWIMTNLSADNLEAFNYIVNTDGYTVDSVYIPAFNTTSVPDGFMDERDAVAYEEFLGYADDGLFELNIVKEGDEFELYGMAFQILSDMLDIQSGQIIENSMLFRMEMNDKSVLFCSHLGYEQGQAALNKYGNALSSDYVQIASGSGTGLGWEFYNTVNPTLALCDSIKDDAGRQTYDLLVSTGIQCYCLDNGSQTKVIIE